jgi:HEAT repeat protein
LNDKLEAGRTLESLRRKNLEGKRTFIEELKKQKTPKSISLLLEILCDESWYLRELSIGALVDSGSMSLEPLRGVFASGLWYTRAAAARALGLLGDEPSADGILSLLDESNRTVRQAAVEAVQSLARTAGPGSLCRSLAKTGVDRRQSRLHALRLADPDLADRLEAGAGEIEAARHSTPPVLVSPAERAEADDGGVKTGPS